MKDAGPSRFVFWLIVAVYLLRLVAQAAVTPWGEGLDFFGHLAYIVYVAEQGRPPSPGALSVPAWVQRMNEVVPGPDESLDGQRYHAWAALESATRADVNASLKAVPAIPNYVKTNHQSQHPPLYYWLLSWVWRWFAPGLSAEQRVFVLTLLSIGLSASVLPALYGMFRLYVNETTSLLVLLAVTWYPNLLLFLGRLTNDALAMALMAAGLYLGLLARLSGRRAHFAAATGLLLLAAFAKTYALTLLPWVPVCALTGQAKRRWPSLALVVPLLALGLMALFAFNLRSTGHLIPLVEMQFTDRLSLTMRLAALVQVDPIWFVGGLAKGFWWFGGWSFVSPGVFYYLPPLAPVALLAIRPHRVDRQRDWFSWRILWPHYAALALFVVGMLWHAALFTLDARLTGQARHSGNEGWYADVLLGSVAVILIVLLKRRLSDRGLVQLLVMVIVFFIIWSWLGQVTLFMYWGGMVTVSGVVRGVRWEQFIPALFNQHAWANWLSLPGILHPVLLTFALPQALALGATAVVLWRLAGRRVNRRSPALQESCP